MWWLWMACSTPTPVSATPVPTYEFSEARPWFGCPDIPDGVVEVVAFDAVHQAFVELNTREVTSEVIFPDGEWAQVGLRLQLECPTGELCDSWDRTASLRLLDTAGEPETELLRYITPYKREMCAYVDITDLAGELTGTRSIESWIDTWVGPGHPDGAGWNVSATFIFTPGQGSSTPSVVPIWPRRTVSLGDPTNPVSSQLGTVDVDIPSDATRIRAHLVTTGHGFGFTDNCAEFCRMPNLLTVDGNVFESDPWRANCENNPIDDQLGTWELDRNGWCPGAVALGRKIDITDALTIGTTNTISFDVQHRGSVFVEESSTDGFPFTEVSLHLLVERD